MMKTLIVAARDRARLAEITAVASRFGLQSLAGAIGMTRDDPLDTGSDSLPRRTRMALEALGPTFVKLGQILATRGDLLSADWIAELERLHSQAPTLPFEALRADVEAALGEPPETAFARFDPEPLAAASMAQVHRASRHDGRALVLKIRRPGIRARMEADLRIITHLAGIAEAANAEARRFQPVAMARQLAAAMLEELDFTAEARNADRMREDFAGDDCVVVPDIDWEHTSEALLVMDYIAGTPPRDAATLVAAGLDPHAIATLGVDTVLDMVFVNGRFHADPHPGNLLCLPGNRIALLDLGTIGHVSPRRRREFLAFTQALASGDADALADVLGAWSAGTNAPREAVVRAAERLTQQHGGGRMVLRAIIADSLAVVREEGLAMPPDLLLIFRALVTIDGVLTGIQPDFDLSAAIRRASLRLVRARLAPEAWSAAGGALAAELFRLGDDAPRLVRALVRKVEDDGAGQMARSGDLVAAIRSAGQTLACAVIGGAVVIAAAVWLHP
ncbi:ABC1 kinase family protein [Sphingomonas sp. RS2018]